MFSIVGLGRMGGGGAKDGVAYFYYCATDTFTGLKGF